MSFDALKEHVRTLINIARQRYQMPESPKIVLGLSGGPDSVFLLHLLCALRKEGALDIVAAHLDHGWRPDSAKDAQFCKRICELYQVDAVVKHVDELGLIIDQDIKDNGSKEDLGRQLRRYLFGKVYEEHKAHLIALAHHQQDQQETFFIRLLRGASLAGLTCMKDFDMPYIRPLLHTDKEFILNYLKEHNLEYVEDPTNKSDEMLRNRIRKYLIPALKLCDTRFSHNFEGTLGNLKHENGFIEELMVRRFQDVFNAKKMVCPDVQSASKVELVGKCDDFLQTHRVIRYRMLIEWLNLNEAPYVPSYGFLSEILRFLDEAKDGTHAMHHEWHVHKQKKLFWICRQQAAKQVVTG